MGSTTFIVWRESIEAMLVIGILYTWLKNQADTGNGMRFLWGGVAAGVGLALGLAFIMLKVQSELAGEALEYFQIAIVLFAALLITQMVLWMRHRGRTLKRDLEAGMQRAHEQANWWGMAALAAIAVGREGAETVIFLYGTGLAQTDDTWLSFAGAAATGFALAFFSFWLLSQGRRFISWRAFFRFSEILLLLLAAALLTDGVDRMIGMGWLPALIDPVWDSSFLLDDSTRFGSIVAAFTGYRAHPALSLLLIYAAYWITVALLLRRPVVPRQPQGEPA